MNKNYAKNSLVLIVLVLIILLAGCAVPKAQEALLPDGLSSAMVPDMPLDGYLYVRQSQPTVIAGAFLGLSFDPAIQSIEAWIVPSDAAESFGAVLTFVTRQDAEAIFRIIPDQTDLWKTLAGNNIYVVWGTGSGAEGLKKAVNDNHFVSLKESDSDAWNLIGRFPGTPDVKPSAVGFVRVEDRLIDFAQKNSPAGSNESVVSAIKLAKISIAVAAFYSTGVLKITDLLSPSSLKEAGAGGILIAKSDYPGFVISSALGQASSRVKIEKTDIDGKTAYYTSVDAPAGEKVHVFFNNSGQYIYASGAADLARSQQIYRWVLGAT